MPSPLHLRTMAFVSELQLSFHFDFVCYLPSLYFLFRFYFFFHFDSENVNNFSVFILQKRKCNKKKSQINNARATHLRTHKLKIHQEKTWNNNGMKTHIHTHCWKWKNYFKIVWLLAVDSRHLYFYIYTISIFNACSLVLFVFTVFQCTWYDSWCSILYASVLKKCVCVCLVGFF